MSRMIPPEPDRWYLQLFEVVEYDMKQIKRALMLGGDDPSPYGFIPAYPIANHLKEMIRIGAINQERLDNPPLIVRYPDEDN